MPVARLPFRPAPVETLRERFPLALDRVWRDPAEDAPERPGMFRTHVFDFEHGMRLIISKERHAIINGGRLHIHVSASWNAPDDIKAFTDTNGVTTPERLTAYVQAMYSRIGGRGTLVFIGTSEGKAVPHWIVDLGDA